MDSPKTAQKICPNVLDIFTVYVDDLEVDDRTKTGKDTVYFVADKYRFVLHRFREWLYFLIQPEDNSILTFLNIQTYYLNLFEEKVAGIEWFPCDHMTLKGDLLDTGRLVNAMDVSTTTENAFLAIVNALREIINEENMSKINSNTQKINELAEKRCK